MSPSSKTYALASGRIPANGLGTWQSKPNEVRDAALAAYAVGYRHIDGAAVYQNETEVGEALAQMPRGEVFVTSKLWNTHHAIGNVKKGCQQTLKDLGTSFLDLYLIHWPVHFKYEGLDVLTPKNSDGTVAIDTSVNIVDTWKEMEKLVDEGLVKDIGVSNFTIAHLETILKSCRIKPAVNQVELHPYLPQQALLDFCTKNGIHMTAYSPLGSGKEGGPLSNETIAKIAQAHSATPAQILLSWAIQRGTSVIPKSVNPSRIAENFKTITLSESDMKEIAKLGEKKKRFIDPYAFWNIDIFGEK